MKPTAAYRTYLGLLLFLWKKIEIWIFAADEDFTF